MKKRFIIIGMVVICAALAGFAAYGLYRAHHPRSDVYIDRGGCAESHSGGIHPDYCLPLER